LFQLACNGGLTPLPQSIPTLRGSRSGAYPEKLLKTDISRQRKTPTDGSKGGASWVGKRIGTAQGAKATNTILQVNEPGLIAVSGRRNLPVRSQSFSRVTSSD
jgi:hypothetical protein